MKERVNYIDWLKAIAIISVVMGHVIGFDFFSLEDSSKSFLNRFITSIHMPLFIFLSGLVVSYKFESITDICKKLFIKARVLLFPVILVGIPYALWRGFTLYEFVTSPMKYGYWYLLTLFELYILLYLVIYISKFTKFKWGEIICGFFVWCGLKGIGHLHLNADFLNAIQFTQLVVCIGHFSL